MSIKETGLLGLVLAMLLKVGMEGMFIKIIVVAFGQTMAFGVLKWHLIRQQMGNQQSAIIIGAHMGIILLLLGDQVIKMPVCIMLSYLVLRKTIRLEDRN